MAIRTGTSFNNKLTGTAQADRLVGLGGNDLLIGLAAVDTLEGGAGNDTMDGGAGNDRLVGGAGNDLYIVTATSGNDQYFEVGAGGGLDTIRSSRTFTLGAPTATANHIENLVLTGASKINGTGNSLDNFMTGNAAVNTLTGGAGNDTFDGGAGNDRLVGGIGNDVYIVTATSGTDQYIEVASKGGTDTIRSARTFTLGTPSATANHIENLTLTGTGSINGTGNSLNNAITGNTGANVLNGGAGADKLDGGAGNDTLDGGAGTADTLLGGAGADTLIWDAADTLRDGGPGADIDILRVNGTGQTVNLSGAGTSIKSIETVNITGTGNNTLVLDEGDVNNMSASTNTLKVDGNAGDVVNAAGQWTHGGLTGDYNIFTSGTAILHVHKNVDFNDQNDAPVAVDETHGETADTGVQTGSVAGNDTDPDFGDTLTYALNESVPGVSMGADGSYSLDTNHPNFVPLGEGNSQDVLVSYTVSDGRGGSDMGQLTITIVGVNDEPTAVDDSATVDEDGAGFGSVAGNDLDDSGSSHTYTLNPPGATGLTMGTDGSYSFDTTQPQFQSLGVGDSVTVTASYTLSDGAGGFDDAVLTITVQGTNDAPDAVNDTASATEGTGTATGSVAGNDTDTDVTDVRTYALTESSVAGLTMASTGGYSFDSNNAAYQSLGAGETIQVTATYTLSDGEGGTDNATLTITVTGTNDAPNAVNDSESVFEDNGMAGGSVAGNDTDADATDGRTYTLTAPVSGLSMSANGDYSFDTTQAQFQSLGVGETTVVTANYTLSDGEGGSDTATLTITVTGVNDAPEGADASVTVLESGMYTFTLEDFLFTDSELDSPPHDFAGVEITTLPGSGQLFLDGDTFGTGTFVSAADIEGGLLTLVQSASAADTTFTFQVRDDGGTANGGSNTDPEANTMSIDMLDYFGNAGANNMGGDEGDNRMSGLGGEDTIEGGDGNDTMWGGLDSDTMIGGVGDDAMFGGDGNDNMDGGDDANQLSGGLGSDTLIGGAGSSLIFGGAGADEVVSGEGMDVIAYETEFLTEGAAAGANTGFDFIGGFSTGNDIVWFVNEAGAQLDDGDTTGEDFSLQFAEGEADFNGDDEALLVAGLDDADLTAVGFSDVLLAINDATGVITTGNDGLILVTADTDSGIYYYRESSGDGGVQASELTLVAVFDNVLLTESDVTLSIG